MFVPLVQKEPDHHFMRKGECVSFTFTNKRTKHDILNVSYNKGERDRVPVSLGRHWLARLLGYMKILLSITASFLLYQQQSSAGLNPDEHLFQKCSSLICIYTRLYEIEGFVKILN